MAATLLRMQEVGMSHRYKSQKANKAGKMCVIIIVLAMVCVMSVQIVNLNEKNQQYIAQQESLEKQKEAELARQEELEEYEAYTKTKEYVEEIAKSKLGLVYQDETIFKEKPSKNVR